jgi:hypothetical protein
MFTLVLKGNVVSANNTSAMVTDTTVNPFAYLGTKILHVANTSTVAATFNGTWRCAWPRPPAALPGAASIGWREPRVKPSPSASAPACIAGAFGYSRPPRGARGNAACPAAKSLC